VRRADGEPGAEVQVDFGRRGVVPDPRSERRVAHGLVFTPAVSRYLFCWLTLEETTAEGVVAQVAEWPGCMTAGAKREEAIAHLEDAKYAMCTAPQSIAHAGKAPA